MSNEQQALVERTLEESRNSGIPPEIQAQIERQLRNIASEIPAQAPEPAPSAPPAPEAPTEPQSDIESIKARLTELEEEKRLWQARYSTLRGKYDAEIAAMRTQKPEPAEPPIEPIQTRLKQELGNKFEDDAVELAAAAARAAMAEMQRELTPLKETVSSHRQLALQATLDTRIPDWRNIASDPSYQQWLGEADPISGLSRQAIMATALQTGDVERVEAVLGAYRTTKPRTQGQSQNQGQTVPGTAAVPKPRNPQATHTPPTPEPPTAAEWRELANRVARREISPAAAEEMFTRMMAAMRQG